MQVTWKECLSDNAAWDTLTWFAALIGMASYLNKYGFIKWFSNQVCRSFSISSKLHNGSKTLSLTACSPVLALFIPLRPYSTSRHPHVIKGRLGHCKCAVEAAMPALVEIADSGFIGLPCRW